MLSPSTDSVSWDIPNEISRFFKKNKEVIAERGFDPRTSGLWAQHASTAPLCSLISLSGFSLILNLYHIVLETM